MRGPKAVPDSLRVVAVGLVELMLHHVRQRRRGRDNAWPSHRRRSQLRRQTVFRRENAFDFIFNLTI